MRNPNVLILVDEKDLDLIPQTDSIHWNIYWKTVNHDKIFRKISDIQKCVIKNNIDLVVYSRNDQVANRIKINHITAKLKIGTCSFSGIDEKFRIKQMLTCYDDFIKCNKKLNFDVLQKEDSRQNYGKYSGSFSLIFDAEQLGCFRYGIPRIMKIFNEYNVKATFFVTNVMKRVYSNAIEYLRERGHEVGIHGQWHEQLSGLDVVKQTKMINKMKNDFPGPINGANFIGRMDNATVSALVSNNFMYFVYLAVNYYQPFRYPKLSTHPVSINGNEGQIWALPISINTYSLPWFSIKKMIDSVVVSSKKNGFPHITLLLHPFRDGNINHIRTTQRLLKYLIKDLDLKPITLEQHVERLDPQNCRSIVNYEDFKAVNNFKRKLRFPETKQDFLGFSDILVRLYKLLRKNHDVF